MKKVFLSITLSLFMLSSFAQENMPVALHYVTVKSSDAEKLINLEKNYFAKLHKARIEAGEKIGWDMWQLENNYKPGHTTFVYVHLQPTLDLQNLGGGDPSALFSEQEMALVGEQLGKIVVDTKFIMTAYKGGFAPISSEPVNYVQLSYMTVDPTSHYDYEQMELVNFMPGHKSNPLMKGWALHRINTPHAEGEPDYLTANFFESMEDIFRNTDGVAKLTKQQKMNYQKILDLREMVKVEILSLVMAVR